MANGRPYGTYVVCRRCRRKVYGPDLAAIRYTVHNVEGKLWIICGKCLDKHGNTSGHTANREAPTEEP
jgi:hypothetical protein